MSQWLKLSQWIDKVIIVIASIGLLFTMGTIVVNVIGRVFFESPLLGTVEVVGLAGAFLIPFALVLTERNRAHIVVRMLISRFPQWLQSLFAIFTFFLSLGGVVLLFWAGVLQFREAFTPGFETQALRIPKPPFVIVWLCGILFLFGFLLKHFIEELIKARNS